MKNKHTIIQGLVFYLFCISVNAQQREIKGSVKNSRGKKISDVVVNIKGTKRYAVTTKDGNYLLRANSNDVLIFSANGYHLYETKIGHNTKINAELASILPVEPEDLDFYDYKITQKLFWTTASKSLAATVNKEFKYFAEKLEPLFFWKSKSKAQICTVN